MHTYSFTLQEPANLVNHPSQYRDTEHPASHIAQPSGLTMYDTIIGKSAEDPMIQKLPTARPKLAGTAKMKLPNIRTWVLQENFVHLHISHPPRPPGGKANLSRP